MVPVIGGFMVPSVAVKDIGVLSRMWPLPRVSTLLESRYSVPVSTAVWPTIIGPAVLKLACKVSQGSSLTGPWALSQPGALGPALQPHQLSSAVKVVTSVLEMPTVLLTMRLKLALLPLV